MFELIREAIHKNCCQQKHSLGDGECEPAAYSYDCANCKSKVLSLSRPATMRGGAPKYQHLDTSEFIWSDHPICNECLNTAVP